MTSLNLPTFFTEDNLLCQLAKTCRSSRLLATDALAHLGLHPGQEMIMFALWQQDGLTQNQLAERLEVQPPTVSKMLQRLAERQPSLIERRTCKRDQRVTRVFLSPAGKAQKPLIWQQWQRLEQHLFAGLSDAETLLLKRLLSHIHNNAQAPFDNIDNTITDSTVTDDAVTDDAVTDIDNTTDNTVTPHASSKKIHTTPQSDI